MQIKEVNSGILAIKSNLMKELLPKVKNKNAAKEYYLTDIVELAKQAGIKAVSYTHLTLPTSDLV